MNLAHEILDDHFRRDLRLPERERELDPPEPPKLTKETAERILRDEYSPRHIESALNEDSYYGPRLHQAIKLRDALEVGLLIMKLYEDHISACADEMVEKQ